MRNAFDKQLNDLRDRLSEMAAEAEAMLRDAVDALVRSDGTLAGRVIERDDAVDRKDQEIEALCLRLVTLQQPMASDWRLVSLVLRAVSDVERIADYAVEIARLVLRGGRDDPYAGLVDLPALAADVVAMVHEAFAALADRDLGRLWTVGETNAAVDTRYREIQRDLNADMRRYPDRVVPASLLLFAAHYLHRIADHALALAESVRVAETGESSRAR